MYSISNLSKLSSCSEKAIRLYEKNGLLSKVQRKNNNYRVYSSKHLNELKQVLILKTLGLSLKEISSIIGSLNESEVLDSFYQKQLRKTEKEIEYLEKRKNELTKKINVTQTLNGKKIKGVTMEKTVSEILNLKKAALSNYSQDQKEIISFIERENFFDSEIKIQFIEDVKSVIEYLKKSKIKIGPLRGSSSSSLILEILGLNSINPLNYNLVPERFNKEKLFLDFDVEFDRGNDFIWFCKELTHNRPYKFEAYKLPIIDVISNVEKRIKKKIDPKKIGDFELYFKEMISKGDYQFISMVDFPENTKCYKYFEKENKLWNQKENFKILKPQNIYDLWGYISMEGRESASEKLKKFLNNQKSDEYEKLPDFVKNIIQKNRGHLLYQEEWLLILGYFINNNFEKAEKIRNNFRTKGAMALENINLPREVLNLLVTNFESLFNFSHIASTWQHAKVTAYLKHFHREIYLEEIEKFEKNNPNYSWADFGFKSNGLILMQD